MIESYPVAARPLRLVIVGLPFTCMFSASDCFRSLPIRADRTRASNIREYL